MKKSQQLHLGLGLTVAFILVPCLYLFFAKSRAGKPSLDTANVRGLSDSTPLEMPRRLATSKVVPDDAPATVPWMNEPGKSSKSSTGEPTLAELPWGERAGIGSRAEHAKRSNSAELSGSPLFDRNPKPSKQDKSQFDGSLAADGPVPWMAEPALENQRKYEESRDSSPSIAISVSSDLDAGALPAVTKISPTHFAVDFKAKDTRMFYLKVMGAKGKTVRFDMKGVYRRWASLNPVYADGETHPMDPAPLPPPDFRLPSSTTLATNGPRYPNPAEDSWHFVENVWYEPEGTHISLSFVQQFDADSVLLAMKFPYTSACLRSLTEELSHNVSVKSLTIGTSKSGQPLQVLQIADGTQLEHQGRPCILLYAREHPDEHDGSWVVDGAARFLAGDSEVAKELRSKLVFILVPILDPDGATNELHENIISTFTAGESSSESRAYADYFSDWISQGNQLNLAINIHCVESGEGPHIFCPAAESERLHNSAAMSLTAEIAERATLCGYHAATSPKMIIDFPDRLGGWLSRSFGTIHLPLEVNSQERARHLDRTELMFLGTIIAERSAAFMLSTQVDAIRKETMSLFSRKRIALANAPKAMLNNGVFEKEEVLEHISATVK